MLWNGQMDLLSFQRTLLSSKFMPKPAVHSLDHVFKATEIDFSIDISLFFSEKEHFTKQGLYKSDISLGIGKEKSVYNKLEY